MWQSKLTVSSRQLALLTLFYSLFIVVWMMMLHNTYLDDFAFVGVMILVFEWWRACRYCYQLTGHFALLYETTEVYWLQQRWAIIQPPLFLRYIVVLTIQSQRDRKKRVLFLMNHHFSPQDWRSFNYFLRQFVHVD